MIPVRLFAELQRLWLVSRWTGM